MKYLSIEISRKQFSSITVAVPDDFDIGKDLHKIDIDKIADNTVDYNEWEEDIDNPQVEMEEAKFIDEEWFRQYKGWNIVTNELDGYGYQNDPKDAGLESSRKVEGKDR